jgi:hypothetical protein
MTNHNIFDLMMYLMELVLGPPQTPSPLDHETLFIVHLMLIFYPFTFPRFLVPSTFL